MGFIGRLGTTEVPVECQLNCLSSVLAEATRSGTLNTASDRTVAESSPKRSSIPAAATSRRPTVEWAPSVHPMDRAAHWGARQVISNAVVSRALGRVALVLSVAVALIAMGPLNASATALPATAAGVDRAWTWVLSMLRTSTPIASDSSVTPVREYPADWTGPVTGTFTIGGVTPPPVTAAAVVLSSESSVAAAEPDYRGPVSGQITLPAQPNRWIIQVYREQDGRRIQVPLQTLVRPDNSFGIDLQAVSDPGVGSWQFGVLDAQAGYAPVGLPWPSSGTYNGWEVKTFATTDRRYLIDSQPAAVNGTFTFARTAPGTKTFQLVATNPTGQDTVLAEYAPTTGLVRSFQPGQGSGDSDLSYTYDQALALQSALVRDDMEAAGTLAAGLLRMQTADGAQAGGFISVAAQANPAAGSPVYRTGNTAVATYALLRYLRHANGAEAAAVRAAAQGAIDWLLRQQLTDGPMSGLLTGGWGTISGGAAHPDERLTWAATEHNLDAWQALSLAAVELDCPRCAAAADTLRQAILTVLWDPATSGFSQGMRPEGRDTVEPLDVNSWGSIFLDAAHRPDLAAISLNRTAAFAVVDQGAAGFLAFTPQPSVPNPVSSVWFEGSFGVALAQARHADAAGYAATMSGLASAQRADGSMPMATSPDPDQELTTASAMAATTWFILAANPDHPDSLWAPPAAGRS